MSIKGKKNHKYLTDMEHNDKLQDALRRISSLNNASLTVEYKGLSCAINHQREGNLNIITNFNPIRKQKFIELLDHCPPVEYVRSTQRYGKTEGGINLKLRDGWDEQSLSGYVETFLRATVN
jgi:hypothetical protein